MLDKKKEYILAPFFWTRSFNKSLAFTGVPHKYDEVVIKGDLNNIEKPSFSAVYCYKEYCHAMTGMGKSHDIITFN